MQLEKLEALKIERKKKKKKRKKKKKLLTSKIEKMECF